MKKKYLQEYEYGWIHEGDIENVKLERDHIVLITCGVVGHTK